MARGRIGLDVGSTAVRAAEVAVGSDPPSLVRAAQVLAGSKEPLNTKAMIEQMAAKGLWTSPGGKTPHATLYSAILREINEKGAEARFVKIDRGQFTIRK